MHCQQYASEKLGFKNLGFKNLRVVCAFSNK